MFREMVRKHQQLPHEECIQILKKERRGVLSVIGDEGYPYGMPLNHWYCEEDGKLYFHGGDFGHRVDAIKRCDKVSFCVYDKGYRKEGDWALNIRSVIVFGRVTLIEDPDEAMDIVRKLSYEFTQDEAFIEGAIQRSGHRTLCFALTPEYMTGKLVNES